jgi:hypothetical protein
MNTEEKFSRIKRIKKHIKDNKKEYIIGIGGIAVGAAGFAALFYGTQEATLLQVNKARKQYLSNVNNVIAIHKERTTYLGGKGNTTNYIYQHISKFGNKIGPHGNAVREIDPETGRTIHEYRNQLLASLDAGVSQNSMSRHLDGKNLNLKGRTFERMNLEWITNPSEIGMFE